MSNHMAVSSQFRYGRAHSKSRQIRGFGSLVPVWEPPPFLSSPKADVQNREHAVKDSTLFSD